MKTLLLFLALFVTASQAATVRLYFVDPLTNEKDTNAFYVTPIGTNVLSNGGVVGRGVTTRYVPASNGYKTNTLAVGHYSITNRSLGSGVVIRVPDSSSLYDYTNLLISGYNIFVTVTNGEGGGTSGALTNNETRAVTFESTLTIGGGSSQNPIAPSAGQLTFANSILVDGAFIQGRTIIGTNFVGNGAGLTNLPDVATQSGLAAGSYPLFAYKTNALYAWSTNGLSIYKRTGTTNSGVFIGNGSIQLPQKQHGVEQNLRNGVEFWPDYSGIGELYPALDNVSVPLAFIHCETNWGNSGALSTLHIASQGDIRLEPGFAGHYGTNYLSLGNEDNNTRVFLNHIDAINDVAGDNNGYSLPLQLQVTGKRGASLRYGSPGIQGYFENTNTTPRTDIRGNSWHLGGLRFLALCPDRDLTNATYGVQNPLFEKEVGRTLTNGWRFGGNVEYVANVSIPADTNVILDFNSNSRQIINLVHVSTNYFQTTNISVYGGETNWAEKTFRINAGALARPLRWPSGWSYISSTGSVTMPTLLAASNFISLKLEALGSGDTNVVCTFNYGADKSFYFDPDALNFFTRASITDATQIGAVDYLAKALKATTISYSNLWSKIRVLYPMVGGTSNANAMNLRSTSYPVIYTSSGVTHDANGITGNGSSGYGNTQFTHNNAEAITNMHLLVYNRTTLPADSSRFIGAYNTAGTFRSGLLRNGASLGADGPMSANAPATIGSVSSDFRGILAVTRPNEAGVVYGMSRSLMFTNSYTATGVIPVTYDLLARHAESGDSHFNFSDANLALVSIGDGLTVAELQAYRDIVNNYQTILGRNVP